MSPRSLKNLAESLYNTALLATTSNRSRIIEIGPPTTLLLSTITMSTGNEDVTDPQDTAVCRALTISPDEDGTYSEENECDCPRCEPANDAFIPRSDIDPHRRIVRARRPPQAASSSSSTAAAPFGSEGNFISNATTTTTSESAVHAQNLSSAINILHQLNNNNNNGRPSRGTAVQQVVSDSDDESMPPLEDIGPPESNGGASNVNPLNTNSNNSTIRRRVGNGANTNSFSALGEFDNVCLLIPIIIRTCFVCNL